MIKRIIISSLCFLGITCWSSAAVPSAVRPKLILFHSLTCNECAQVKEQFFPQIKGKYQDRIDIEYLDIGDIDNYKLMLGLQNQYKPAFELRVPVIFMEGEFLSGRPEIISRLENLIRKTLEKSSSVVIAKPEVDLVKYFLSFTPLAVVSAGLIDGINPCAFTVIVFFISFLALQGYRKKELLIIGSCFIFAVFFTYLLLGVGLFSFLYSLKGFWIVRRIANLGIGVLSFGLGGMAVGDFLKYKKTASTAGMSLQLPQAVKNRIHAVIGMHYRKGQDNQATLPRKTILRVIFTAFITGFLVSLLEAVCTGQVYLPTITFVLKAAPIKLQALGYLLLYNLMFILPLVVIFFFSLMGVSSAQFSQVFKKNFLTVKILMAVLFFSLGIFLIWRG